MIKAVAFLTVNFDDEKLSKMNRFLKENKSTLFQRPGFTLLNLSSSAFLPDQFFITIRFTVYTKIQY